jgi:hypothetical protein
MRSAPHTPTINACRVTFAVGMFIVITGVVITMRTSGVAAVTADATVTLSPAPGVHPYANGQSIAISVGANSRFTPNARIEVLECAAPKGLLPVDDTVCDGNTVPGQSILVGQDGSFSDPAYLVYQLPSQTLGEQLNHLPVCSANEECVLYVGQDQNDFTAPKLFSVPFTVGSTSSVPTTTGTTIPVSSGSSGGAATRAPTSSAASAAVTLSPGASTTNPGSGSPSSSGSLAFTGAPSGLLWMVIAGVAMMLTGMAGRLAARRVSP